VMMLSAPERKNQPVFRPLTGSRGRRAMISPQNASGEPTAPGNGKFRDDRSVENRAMPRVTP
jgi:hypothetical protein